MTIGAKVIQRISAREERFCYSAVTVLVVCASILLGLDLRSGLTLVISFVFVVLAVLRLEWGIYAIVAFAVLCIDGWTPTRSPDDVVFRLGIGRFYITELAVYSLLGIYVLKRNLDAISGSSRPLFAQTPLDWPLKLFAILLPIFAVYGLAVGNAPRDALGYDEWRSLFMAIVFYFLVTSIITTNAQTIRLFWWFLGSCSIAGAYSLMAYLMHFHGVISFVFGSGPYYEGPENCMFVFAALVSTSLLMFWRCRSRTRILLVLAAVIPMINVLVSEKRDPQLGLTVGLAVLIWQLPFKRKMKWGVGIGCALLTSVLLISVLGIKTTNTGLAKSASRYSEVRELIENPQKLAVEGNETLLFHIFDLIDSFNSIRQRPILGYGFGGQFVRRYTSLTFIGGENTQPGIVHDQYLDLWLKMGALGLFAFLWVLLRFFRFGRAVIPRPPGSQGGAIALGFYAAMLGDLALEISTPNWIGGTKMPIVFLLSFAMVVCLSRACQVVREW